MLITLAWFTESGKPYNARRRGLHDRLAAFVSARTTPTWHTELIEGQGWGMFATSVAQGNWNWDLVARKDGLVVASVGVPVGADDDVVRRGPAAAGSAALAGKPVFDGVVPPFGIVATNGEQFVAQQDWFGMAPLYKYQHDGVVAIANRPILLPYAFGQPIQPDHVGWAHYAACDGFTGPTSPVAGVTPLPPGEVIRGEVTRNCHWRIDIRRRSAIDDIVADAAGNRADVEPLLLSGLTRASTSLALLWPEPLRFGLSGGRDSRLLAANMIANKMVPTFYTNTEVRAEGEVAARLIGLARKERGVDYPHDLRPPRTGGTQRGVGVSHRLQSHFLDFDFTSRRHYVLQGAAARHWQLPPANVSGGIGDIAWGIWVPDKWKDTGKSARNEMAAALRRGLASKAGGPLSADAEAWLRNYLDSLLQQSRQLGLDPVQSMAWLYCVSRGRAWPVPRQAFQRIMLYATPEFVTAVVNLPLSRQRGSLFHRELTERLMPEWRGIEYVHGGPPPGQGPLIWADDGMPTLLALAESTTWDIAGVLDRDAVCGALTALRSGAMPPRQGAIVNRLLTTFAVLATAEREFDTLNRQLATQPMLTRARALARTAWPARLPLVRRR